MFTLVFVIISFSIITTFETTDTTSYLSSGFADQLCCHSVDRLYRHSMDLRSENYHHYYDALLMFHHSYYHNYHHHLLCFPGH